MIISPKTPFKPRLQPLALTVDDAYIWGMCCGRALPRSQWTAMFDKYQHSDRRDADLMLMMDRVKRVTWLDRPQGYPRYPIAMSLIRGAMAVGLSWPNSEPL